MPVGAFCFDVGGWCCFLGFAVLGLAVVLCVCYLL